MRTRGGSMSSILGTTANATLIHLNTLYQLQILYCARSDRDRTSRKYYQRRPWVPDKTSIPPQAGYISKSNSQEEQQSQVLGTLGERTILSDIIMPRIALGEAGADGIGDDCAEIAVPPAGHTILATTDPCPSPVAFVLGDHDYWHYGRMTVLINVSDLAAMGAKPIGILVSTVMPNDMLINDYQRFLDG